MSSEPHETGPDGLGDALLRAELKSRLFDIDPRPVRIGKYRLLERVGRGGMAVVYAAHDEELERKVAIKVLRSTVAFGVERMQREARAMARLCHPNVAAVYDVGFVDERVYIAMEFVEGQTLRQFLARAPTRPHVLDAFLQAARGLSAAHDAGLVHRDFKPENVLVGTDGRVRVADFGLARSHAAEPTLPGNAEAALPAALTHAGDRLGTPAYMAPEQIADGPVDARTDQFAFCLALYEALYDRRPFVEPSELAGGIAVVCPAAPAVPEDLRRAIERGLSLRAADRHRDLRPIIDVLERARTPAPQRRPRAWWMAIAIAIGVPAVSFAVCVPGDPSDEQLEAGAPEDEPQEERMVPAPSGACEPLAEPTAASSELAKQRDQLETLLRATSPDDPAHADILRRLGDKEAQLGNVTTACERYVRAALEPHEDELARCRVQEMCEPPLEACPVGTAWRIGEGCVSQGPCDMPDTTPAQERCENGSITCCRMEAIRAEYEFLEAKKQGEEEAHARWKELAAALYVTACERGDAAACETASGWVPDDHARRLRERACALGRRRACPL